MGEFEKALEKYGKYVIQQARTNLTKRGKRGGGPNGSTTSKSYKKRYRGQGK